MARKCKTPAKLIELIKGHARYMEYVDDSIRSKTKTAVEYQADYVKAHGVEYWEGMAHGMNEMLERALFDANCYAGFSYLGHKRTLRDEGGGTYTQQQCVGPDHAEYKEWRRMYYTRTA